MKNDKKELSLEERIEILESKKNKKDIWDIVGVLTSFLIPLSIFIAGYFLSEAERKTRITNQEKEIQLAEIKSKVDQALLVSNFLEALIDTNTYKRQLAIKAILLALPEKGEEIVRTVAETDPNESVKTYAMISLDENLDRRRTELIRKVFDKDSQIRRSATYDLTENWQNDDKLIDELINYAYPRMSNEPENLSGIINTIVVLNSLDKTLLDRNSTQLQNFINEVEKFKERTQTQNYLNQLKQRLQP